MYIKKIAIGVAIIAAISGSTTAYANACSVGKGIKSISNTCNARKKCSGFHCKPRASCTATMKADKGFYIIPTSIKSKFTGHGRRSESQLWLKYYKAEPSFLLSQVAVTSVSRKYSCTNKRGTGRTCSVNGTLVAQQMKRECIK